MKFSVSRSAHASASPCCSLSKASRTTATGFVIVIALPRGIGSGAGRLQYDCTVYVDEGL
ncbi:hypothetical protein Ait01nite_026310 [Actinoplanes italicus]|nr:hypothetical protein Ait01nite_026310 [Actinoplanes italicus]